MGATTDGGPMCRRTVTGISIIGNIGNTGPDSSS
jgi:hypothetical protein